MMQEEKFKEAKRLYESANADQKYVLESLFPDLKESEYEKIRKEIVRFIRMEVEDEIVGNKWIAWLESLKGRVQPQKQWKPSEEQMDVLLSEVNAWKKGCSKQKVLESLYNGLKKLKS